MIQRTVLCEASKARASWGWATFSPETDAITAISAMQTAIRIARRLSGSWIVVSKALVGSAWLAFMRSFRPFGQGRSARELGAPALDFLRVLGAAGCLDYDVVEFASVGEGAGALLGGDELPVGVVETCRDVREVGRRLSR